ncbi:Rha family transcriptional regulator [Mesorhizobium amorphae]|uniref:Rha family transcriptional regulator n=1 Tax=Mesorhizobium amorphae TaxID=71433 RepID=UPI0011826BDE|nr:Rha family transcriptional regulator [Mesorhizobium amorphae]
MNATPQMLTVEQVGGTQPLTMSSREIAELCEKQHAHVMRDIRAMLDGLDMGQSNFGSTYTDAQGKVRDCYNLPKNLTLTLVAGYNVKLRARIIDRWMELEGRSSLSTTPIPASFSAS